MCARAVYVQNTRAGNAQRPLIILLIGIVQICTNYRNLYDFFVTTGKKLTKLYLQNFQIIFFPHLSAISS